jgi:hypothetical protein
MNTKEAKDFLVQQAAEQATLEGIPLSDLEKRMMYFTESDPASCPNPIELNDEFEAQYDTPEYEQKLSRLLQRAYDRLKKESPERRREWDRAISILNKGDHYILVLWGATTLSERSKHNSLKLLGAALIVALCIGLATFFADKFNIDRNTFHNLFWLVLVIFILIFTGIGRSLYQVARQLLQRGSSDQG